jgi:hypothetical protein
MLGGFLKSKLVFMNTRTIKLTLKNAIVVPYFTFKTYVPGISDLLYLIFTGMYTFKASSKEASKPVVLNLFWLAAHFAFKKHQEK